MSPKNRQNSKDDCDLREGQGVNQAVASLVSNMLGPASIEVGQFLQQEIRAFRWKSGIRVLERASEFVKDRGISPQAVPAKFLVPFLDSCTLEDDETIQDMWANLLATATDEYSDVHLIFRSILADLSGLEANGLKFLFRSYKPEHPAPHTHSGSFRMYENALEKHVLKAVSKLRKSGHADELIDEIGEFKSDYIAEVTEVEAPALRDETDATVHHYGHPRNLSMSPIVIDSLVRLGLVEKNVIQIDDVGPYHHEEDNSIAVTYIRPTAIGVDFYLKCNGLKTKQETMVEFLNLYESKMGL